ncbi:chemotaxis protein [Citrobacter freundii]|uniref:chemotaxis protein n=1 Tax=Citrobacter freundii complex TaxID=1344959 RepID=UPI0019173D29|nr:MULTISPECIES: chemotaxis protein [Citrobacter freundii complex]MBK6261005.1 chemotaxis protein [Citrobacter youngae]WBM50961.1 chemotaxis protein [Citrobacter freundii]
MANIIVTKTINMVEWSVDKTSYGKALKAIKSLKAAQEKPAKALEAAKKRTAQSEGKAALAAAKAHTTRIKQQQRLVAEQQKQAQVQAKIVNQELAHNKKMAALSAKNAAQALTQDEARARQDLRLSRISERIRAAAVSRAVMYNPNMGGTAPEPGLATAQTAAMSRGHKRISDDIVAAKRRIAVEEKREAALKREVVYYNALRKSALTLANVNGADIATRYKAISAAKEALKAQKEERYTVEETRFEMARITSELRKQARLQQRITKEQKAAGIRAGRVRTEGLTGRGIGGGIVAGGAIGGATLIGSMGVARVGQTLQGSLERSRDSKKLEQYGLGQLEFAAIQDLAMSRAGYSLSADKLADLNKDTTEKAGELLNTGSFKRNKKTGEVTFSGGGEFADIINNVLKSTNGNQKVAQKVIGEIQTMNFPEFILYLKQLQKTFKWTDNAVRHLSEAVNDGSVFLGVFDDEGRGVIDRMRQLASEGWSLSDAQQANLDKLAELGAEYNRVQTSLADHFSASFVEGLGQYATNTDTLRQSMTGLIPIADHLGQSLGELTTNILAWASSIGEELRKGSTLPDAVYNTTVDEGGNAAAEWVKGNLGFDPRTIGQTLKQIYPWLDSSSPNNIGTGTAWDGLALNVPGLNYQGQQPQPLLKPTFSIPTIADTATRGPIPVSVTGTADLSLHQDVDININDGAVKGLIDAKIRENEVYNTNLILGVPQ